MLEIFDRKLKEYGVSGCDLIYSAETVFDSKGG
jgi:hypothetical protein